MGLVLDLEDQINAFFSLYRFYEIFLPSPFGALCSDKPFFLIIHSFEKREYFDVECISTTQVASEIRSFMRINALER